jgi:pimeloyl-ACP methyl ester carboxylesterase
MFSSLVDSLLTRFSARQRKGVTGGVLPTRRIETPVGCVRVYDSESAKPCVVFVPDGPNIIEHYETLFSLLSQRLRVVCFDMPGFGYSLPQPSYGHSLDQGARAVLGVLDGLGIKKATLAFSCANGFYALRAAQLAPERITNLVLSQTPSLTAMHAWTSRVIPWPLRIPVVGPDFRYLPQKGRTGVVRQPCRERQHQSPFQEKALDALSGGACCLASVVQGLASRKNGFVERCGDSLRDMGAKITPTNIPIQGPCMSLSLAEIVHFEDCGHFPDIEQPERFAAILTEGGEICLLSSMKIREQAPVLDGILEELACVSRRGLRCLPESLLSRPEFLPRVL